MTPPVDMEQRRRALLPDRSFIVQAPAGSGKTSLLVQRVLVLLATVDQPEQVVAITFTRKAAAEMRERVVAALGGAAGPAPQAPHERATWELARRVAARDREMGWKLADNPARLRMLTFDALCAMIVRRMPYLSQLGGEGDVTDLPESLYKEAAIRTLGHLDEGNDHAGPVADLLAHLDNNVPNTVELLARMLARRDQWLPHVMRTRQADPEAALAGLEAAVARLIASELAATARAMGGALGAALQPLVAYAAANLREMDAPQAQPLSCWSPDRTDPDSLSGWRGLADLLLTRQGVPRSKPDKRNGFPTRSQAGDAKQMKGTMIDLLGDLDPDGPFVTRLAAVAKLPDADYSPGQRRVVLALLRVLPLAVAQLHLLFAERGALDFAEMALRALQALGDEDAPTDLGLSLDYAIRHLLVDEFQDTSTGQFRLLNRLIAGWQPEDGRTLFLVGDPMQSIYRFREAEVGLFAQTRAGGIGPVSLEYLALSTNFRSAPAVVNWINDGFARVFPEREDPTRGAVCYIPCRAGTGSTPSTDGEVVFHPWGARDDDAEAERVAELIADARRADPDGSIAILVRSRTHLADLLPLLRRRGLAYRAVEISPLAQRPAVADLISLTRALRDPADRVAWLAVLRAPWCGLTLADLLTVVGNHRNRTVAQSLAEEDRWRGLSEEGRNRLMRCWPVLSRALVRRGREPLAGLVAATWAALWGPATCTPADLNDTRRYLSLLEGLDQGGDVPLTLLNDRIDQLYAEDAPATRLEVMTIHKAKGLEFDTVIVPGLGRPPRSNDSPLLRWLERPLEEGEAGPSADLLMAARQATGTDRDRLYDLLGEVEKQRGHFEDKRLLYVAATRARRTLHLLGHGKQDKNGEWRAEGGSLLAHLWPVVGERFEALHPATESAGEAAPPPLLLRRIDGAFAPPIPADPVGVRFTGDAAPERPPTYEWAGELARHVGTVVHRALQRIADGSRWDEGRIRAMDRRFRTALTELGLPPDQHDDAVHRIQTALINTLNDHRGSWLLGPREEARSEWRISGLLNGAVVHRIIDRSFVVDGVRWIVDYKTGIHSGDRAFFLDEEQRRYRPQLEEYARLVSALDPRPIRLGLYFPLMGAWREWEAPQGPL